MCFYVYFLCVVLCKQKTAYEMRISDWSSDVCSSDLEYLGAAARRIIDQAGNAIDRALIDQRAALRCRLISGADLHRPHALRQTLRKCLGNTTLHIEAVSRLPGLTPISHLGDHGPFDSAISVGIIEAYAGGIAARFHGALITHTVPIH